MSTTDLRQQIEEIDSSDVLNGLDDGVRFVGVLLLIYAALVLYMLFIVMVNELVAATGAFQEAPFVLSMMRFWLSIPPAAMLGWAAGVSVRLASSEEPTTVTPKVAMYYTVVAYAALAYLNYALGLGLGEPLVVG